jgi:hypothetical protein
LQYPQEKKGMLQAIKDRPGSIPEAAKAFAEVLGQPVQLELTVGEMEADVQVQETTVVPGAKPSQQEINAAIQDPIVQNVEKILGGKVRDIERVTKIP